MKCKEPIFRKPEVLSVRVPGRTGLGRTGLVLTWLLLAVSAPAAALFGQAEQTGFDQKSISNWLERIKQQEAQYFKPSPCVNQGFMTRSHDSSCLTIRALFLLNEVNARRPIVEEAMRRTLEKAEAGRLEATVELGRVRSEIALERNSVKAELASLETLKAENAALRKEAEALRQKTEALRLETAALKTGLAAVTGERTALADKLNRLEQASENREAAYQAVLRKNAGLAKANFTLKKAYRDLADELHRGVLAGLTGKSN